MHSYDDIILFLQVVKMGSFTDTAKLLKIGHPTISRRIKALEDELGIVLIRRNTKSFEITPNGRQIYEAFAKEVDTFNQLINSILQQKNDPAGTLNISLPMVLAMDFITPFIPEFVRRYPKINLNICYQNRELDLIKDGFDIAIIDHIPRQQTQKIRKIFSTDYHLYCTTDYADRYGTPATLEELREHLVIGHMIGKYTVNVPATITATHSASSEITVIDMPKRIVVNSVLHTQKMLFSGEAIAGLFDFMRNPNAADNLMVVLPDYHFGTLTHYLMKHPYEDNLAAEVFCNFLQEKLLLR